MTSPRTRVFASLVGFGLVLLPGAALGANETGTPGTDVDLGTGGNGGDAIAVGTGQTVDNPAGSTVTGGRGGATNNGTGGAAGAGVRMNGGTLRNDTGGIVAGGKGGYAGNGRGGPGGTGVDADQGAIVNAGAITGGAGGDNTGAGYGGAGGTGVHLRNGTLENSGAITGGKGGAASGAIGGNGGDALVLENAGAVNDGTITGGAGSDAGVFAGGGRGAVVRAGSSLLNNGTITGGEQGGRLGGAGGVGLAIEGDGNSVTNAGTIGGGSGGDAVNINGNGNTLRFMAGASFIGSVVASGSGNALILAGAADATLDLSQFRGFGLYEKHDAGTWQLTGLGSLTGDIVVRGGTLGLSGAMLEQNGGDLSVAEQAGETASLVIGPGSALASGTSGLGVNDGAVGSATVSGEDAVWTNSGDFIVGVAGRGALTVADGGTVAVRGSAMIGGDVTGRGEMLVSGTGATFAVDNDLYVSFFGTGALTVANGGQVVAGGNLLVGWLPGAQGTLNIGAAAGEAAVAPGHVQAAVVVLGGTGDGVLNFNHTASDYVFASEIIGNGAINVLSGVTVLTADNSGFAGTTRLDGGSLVVNGALGGSAEIGAGATLGGSGTVGTTTIASGGTLAPGNSIGTLTVNGDLTFEAGSHFAVEVDPAGSASDEVVVSGAATINGGTVAHIGYVGNYRPFATYRILTAGTGLSGAFDAVTTDFAFLTPDLVYDYGAYTIDLTLARNDVRFIDKATTRNQIATAGGAESLGAGQAVYDAVAGLPDDAVLIGAAFDSLSGEVHASARSVLVEDSRMVRQAANDRLRAALAGAGLPALPVMAYAGGAPVAAAPLGADLALWGQGFGSWGHSDGDGNAAKLTRSLGGFLLGADAALGGNLRLGILGGYSRSAFDVSGRSSSGSADNYHLGLYGGGAWALGAGELGLRGGLAYSWHDIDTRRQVNVGAFGDRPQADYGAGTLQAFGEMGYRFALGPAALEPFAGLAYVGLDTDAFAEAGDFGTAGAALTGAGRSTQTGFATLGLRAAGEVGLGTARLTLTGTLGWRHAFGDVAALATNVFAGGVPFTVAGPAIARDAALLEAGFALHLSDSARLAIAYEGQIADSAQDHGFSARLSARF